MTEIKLDLKPTGTVGLKIKLKFWIQSYSVQFEINQEFISSCVRNERF